MTRMSTLAPLVAVLLATSSGCLSLDPAGLKGKLFVSEQDVEPAATAPVMGTVTVEFHKARGGVTHSVDVALTENMCVQDVIDQAKAGRYFGRCYIDLIRNLPNGQPHVMKVAYDSDRARVSHAANYALHPGDKVKVSEDTTDMFDDLLGKLTGKKKKTRR